jgi:hypothetical protein
MIDLHPVVRLLQHSPRDIEPATRRKAMHVWRRVNPIVVMTLLVSMVSVAHAQMEKRGTFTSQFGWYANGKTYEIEKDHLLFVGEFSGTNFNDAGRGFLHLVSVACPGINDINKAHGRQEVRRATRRADLGGERGRKRGHLHVHAARELTRW